MKKLRMGEISLQDKVHTPGMRYSQDKNTVSSAFPERTRSLYISSYISFLLPIFSPDQVAFFLSSVWINTTSMAAILWVTEVM